jgi:GTP diphosphokinase / guanosine-3',5'-bis(diphosphate) 3'-diphosphatase
MATQSYKKHFDLKKIFKEIKSYLTNFDEEKLQKAFDFAEKAHRGQYRKDGITPYISHPVEAMKILVKLRADEDTLISTLLHDVPEDTEHDIHEVKELFGEKVAFLVDGITKLSKVHYHQNMPERQVESLKKLLLHSAEDLRVVVIKLADRLHNMMTLGNITKEEKRIRIATETLEIYVPIANLLGIREIKVKLEDLCFKHLFPSEYRDVKKKLSEGSKNKLKQVEAFVEIVNKECKKQKISAKIFARGKNIYSIYKTMCSQGKTINDIDNRIAVNVITEDVPSCYQVMGIIHGKYLPKINRFKDYIANPKANGYQSLHTAVFGIDGVLTEVQIKTSKMNDDSEYGIVARLFFGEDTENFFANESNRTDWIKKILELERNDGSNDGFIESLKHDIFQERIFAFTPKGEPIDLPKGATALDFAYAIHTEVGNQACKAKINGKLRSISTTLNTRDIVEIVLSSEAVPALAWLSFAKTNLAKSRILDCLKKADRESQIWAGRKMLQKELDISGLGLIREVSFKKLKPKLIKEFGRNFKTMHDLFAAIGSGEIKASRTLKLFDKSNNGLTKASDKGLRVLVKIVAKNRFGLVRDIYDVFYDNIVDMYVLKGWASKQEEFAYFSADIKVDDLKTISYLFDELEQIEDVQTVYRVTKKGQFLLYFAFAMTSIAWIGHPFFLRILATSDQTIVPESFVTLLLYVGGVFLIAMLYWLNSIVNKYFPAVRTANKTLGWAITFLVPILGIGALALETIYYEFHLNWTIVAFELLGIYAYLLMNYRNYRKSMKKI